MPSEREHRRIDKHATGRDEWAEVHRLLDQFAHYPDMRFLRGHRKFLHHAEGIEYVRLRYGDEAGDAALRHVIADCDHVPTMLDYALERVDNYGCK